MSWVDNWGINQLEQSAYMNERNDQDYFFPRLPALLYRLQIHHCCRVEEPDRQKIFRFQSVLFAF
jgi:hypothetical protein